LTQPANDISGKTSIGGAGSTVQGSNP